MREIEFAYNWKLATSSNQLVALHLFIRAIFDL